jgi:hypothetical protein
LADETSSALAVGVTISLTETKTVISTSMDINRPEASGRSVSGDGSKNRDFSEHYVLV